MTQKIIPGMLNVDPAMILLHCCNAESPQLLFHSGNIWALRQASAQFKEYYSSAE